MNNVTIAMKNVWVLGLSVVAAAIRPAAPAGKWYSDVWRKTNNPAMPRLRIPLTIEIESALSISPTNIVLGQIKAGTEADRKVILRGVRAFRITTIGGTDDTLPNADGSFTLSRTLVALAAQAFQVREVERFALLYTLVWRAHHGELVLGDADDPDLRIVRRWALSVRADAQLWQARASSATPQRTVQRTRGEVAHRRDRGGRPCAARDCVGPPASVHRSSACAGARRTWDHRRAAWGR